MNNAPIGIFDSGLGGLTVWKEIRSLLPGESLYYYGDGMNCPYGEKSQQEIRKFTEDGVQWLIAQGVKMIVIACNTATAAAVSYLREKYSDMIFVGMEPAVKPAAEASRSGVVAILATEASLRGDMFRETASKYAAGVTVLPVAGRGFVEIVENDQEQTPKALETVSEVLRPALDAGADEIVLGCTHYPFLSWVIKRAASGRSIDIINPAPAVARQTKRLLEAQGVFGASSSPRYVFYSPAGPEYTAKLEKKAGKALDMVF